MSLFQPAKPHGRLYVGLYGPEGAGKSHTSINIAVAAKQVLELDGPIAAIDTENAFGFHAERVKQATGQDLMVANTRSLSDVREALGECMNGGASIVIIDSLTHVLRQCRLDWCASKNKELHTMQPQDYGSSDKAFKSLLDKLLVSSLHVILCGREGVKYGTYTNKHGQKKEGPIGTKFNAGEAGYEVDLLLELGRVPLKDGAFQRTAAVRKDRSDRLGTGVLTVPWKASEALAPYFEHLKGGK